MKSQIQMTLDKKSQVVIISSLKTNEYFFTNDHCQDHNLGKHFIPITYYLPMLAKPRKDLEGGGIDTIEKLISIFYSDMKEIENPDIKYRIER